MRDIEVPYLPYRPRRLRRTPGIRDLVRENRVDPASLVQPLFVVGGEGVRQSIASMPGIDRTSIDETLRDCETLIESGIRSVILFGIPDLKNRIASGAYADNGVIQRALREIRRAFPDMTLITDVCLCEYTDHGHCGMLDGETILNDPTVELLARTALTHCEAGADIVAPSDMMDGRVRVIRETLDDNGFADRAIMSYAVKYASAFYGPFRDAADSTPGFGDRRSHQMDPANGREALREALLDLDEGADIIMVKPAMPSLDIIRVVRDQIDVPVAAYQVSGEYSMIHAAAERGWIDLNRAMHESLVAIRRAGASIIVTYFARQVTAAIEDERRRT